MASSRVARSAACRVAWLLYNLLATFYCLAASTAYALSRDPPRIIGDIQTEQLQRAGGTLRLACPVELDSQPIFEWTRDGENIYSGWERFKITNQGLRIRDLSEDDSGHYVCRATNGFGSVTLNYNVYVYHSQPKFTNPEELERHLLRPVGGSVRLRCKAISQPRPLVTWYHNGRELPSDERQPRWTLRLVELREVHSGRYTCRVSNVAGVIMHTFVVEVLEESALSDGNRPIIDLQPADNVTLLTGANTSITCQIQSTYQPHIQWLKFVDNADELIRRRNQTMNINGQQYVVLTAASVKPLLDGSYSSRLDLYNTAYTDTGIYLCLATNSIGFSLRSTHITILAESEQKYLHENRRQSQSVSSWGSIALVVGIPALITVLCIVVAIFLCRRRGEVRKTPQSVNTCTFSGEQSVSERGQSDSKWCRPYDKIVYSTPLLQQNVSSQPGVPAGFHHLVSTHSACILPHHHSPPPVRTNVVLSSEDRWPTSTSSSHSYQLPLSSRDSLTTGKGGGHCDTSMATDKCTTPNCQLVYDGRTPPLWRQLHDTLPIDDPFTPISVNYKQTLHPTFAFQTHLHYGQC